MKKILYTLALIISIATLSDNKAANSTKMENYKERLVLSIVDEKTTYKMDGYLMSKLMLHNNQNSEVTFIYYKPTFWYPMVKEVGTEKKIEVIGEIYDGPAEKITLTIPAFESAYLTSYPVHIIDQVNTLNESKMVCKPGDYTLEFIINGTVNGKEVSLTSSNSIKITIVN